MSSTQSTRSPSPCSSPASQFSELSVATSHTEDVVLDSPRHYLVVSPPSECSSELDAFLRALPLCDKESAKLYLLLAMGHSEATPVGISNCPMPLGETICSMGSILGDESMFKSWSCKQCPEARYYMTASDEECSLLDINSHAVSLTKISHNDALSVFASTGLHLVYCTAFSGSPSGILYLLERAPFSFPPLAPETKAANPFGPPTREEWRALWAAWDLVTLGMIPPEMLHQKPIDLRHKCLFYIGHIPTFLDILISHLFKEPYTEPKNFTQIFERGIDPHVDDPNYCHSHSIVPEADEDWPTLASVLAFRDHVRARLMQLYDDLDGGQRTLSRSVARVLQMTLEHEAFHVETLLYMLIQRAGTGTRPPPGFTSPPWSALAAQWALTPPPASATVTLGPSRVALGHDDSEADDALAPGPTEDEVRAHAFGWDNESPARAVDVSRFRIAWRPVTNGELYAFWVENERLGGLPASWLEEEGEVFVRTVYGPVPLAVAEHWPALAAYDQLAAYARAKGGRLPTEPELRLFLDTHEAGFAHGANVGFRNWHPVPATAGCADTRSGAGSNGGVWEWTSTVFDGHPGLAPTKHFPGYSTDFFDGKHQVVLGASYATSPRLAGRRTVRNFYQHNYPYAWVGARIAYDVDDDSDV